MAVTRDIKRVELLYEAGQIIYVRIVENLSIPNPARPSQIITDENILRASPAELTVGEIADLNDLLGNDIFPLANRLEPIT